MKFASLLSALLLASLTVSLAQVDPKPPPQGNRRDPGLFGGAGQNKDKPKGKDKEIEANSRAVAGVVHNEAEEPVEGAVVQIKDTKTLKVRSYITKADGMYRFFGISNNVDYEIKADFKATASELRTLSVYDGRKQAVVNLKLQNKTKAENTKTDNK